MLINHKNRILNLEKTFDKFKYNEEISKIFFEGELYDAYSLLLDILNKADKEIIIIDNYAGKELNENSVCKNFLHTARDGKNYKTKYYNLDVIIAVGLKVNSKRAIDFRL
mgnify:CR=1 FL=1